jgi:hypothetical protein
MKEITPDTRIVTTQVKQHAPAVGKFYSRNKLGTLIFHQVTNLAAVFSKYSKGISYREFQETSAFKRYPGFPVQTTRSSSSAPHTRICIAGADLKMRAARINGKMNITLCLLLLICFPILAQPLAKPLLRYEEHTIYPDQQNDHLYYYSPANLQLATESDGQPRFQLLQMRYTGTAATGDQGETRFMNLVQFTVNLPELDRLTLREIKEKVGDTNGIFRPLPIQNIEGFLVSGVGQSDGRYQRIGSTGSLQAVGRRGESSRYSFWTERTFTLRLENHEAQLLWKQVEEGNLSVSFGYAFYANLLTPYDASGEITGPGQEVRQANEDLEETLQNARPDTLPVLQAIKSDAFPIYIDTEQWPNATRQLDINQGIPPGYAMLEVRCYDFSDQLRPELAIKSVEIEATSVNGRPITLPPQRFMQSQPDISSVPIQFPYAVLMAEPYRFRVTEYTLAGEKIVRGWETRNNWSRSLDITSQEANRTITRANIDLEASLSGSRMQQVRVIFNIRQFGKKTQVNQEFTTDQTLPLQTVHLVYDKETIPTYQAVWSTVNGDKLYAEAKPVPLTDHYIYLTPPELTGVEE